MSILENIKRRPLYTEQGYPAKSESAKNPSGHYTTSYQKAETTTQTVFMTIRWTVTAETVGV